MSNLIHIFVEGEIDRIIISNILSASGLLKSDIKFHSVGGMARVLESASNYKRENPQPHVIAFIDSDSSFVQDVKKKHEGLPIEVFFAVPTIESWLFADDELVRRSVKEKFLNDATRLPLPEEIPYPKDLFSKWFAGGYDLEGKYAFLKDINIDRAMARCPSLSMFIRRISEILGVQGDNQTQGLGRSDILPRRIFANLIREVAPSQSIVFRTLDNKAITVEDMLKEINDDTPIGKEYIGRVLRVARDILMHSLNK